MQTQKAISDGRLFQIQNGVTVSKKTIEHMQQLHASGMSKRGIAKQMNCSVNTVVKYVK